MTAWFSDADIITAVNAYCGKYKELQPLRSDPEAFTKATVGLVAPNGISQTAALKMFKAGRKKEITR